MWWDACYKDSRRRNNIIVESHSRFIRVERKNENYYCRPFLTELMRFLLGRTTRDVFCTRPTTHSTESTSTTRLLVTQFFDMVELELE
jgi:hypothetical protein